MPDWLQDQPHRRLNPLTGEWVLVSPHRTQRPWQGHVESAPTASGKTYDPDCYLCPGNSRAGGARNPQYTSTFVFQNDFPALLPHTPARRQNESGLLVAEAEEGECLVLCFSPRHDLTLSRMEVSDIRIVVDTWREQFEALRSQPSIEYVQIFENRGEMMGASNPHPHCQIWASRGIPNEIVKEDREQARYMAEKKTCLLCDYLRLEAAGERLVCQNDGFAAVVPFWAVWPFETLVMSKRHVESIGALNDSECSELADILKQITTRYDNLFETPFPYTMGFHQPPFNGAVHEAWHMHAHFYPPLLRSATVKKFMVGYEMLASPQRDFTAEFAAARLRAVPGRHYMDKTK